MSVFVCLDGTVVATAEEAQQYNKDYTNGMQSVTSTQQQLKAVAQHNVLKGHNMELIITMAVIMVAIWYLGKPINAVLAGAGDMASQEFELQQANQQVRLQREFSKLGVKIENSDIKYTKGDVQELLKQMNSKTKSSKET